MDLSTYQNELDALAACFYFPSDIARYEVTPNLFTNTRYNGAFGALLRILKYDTPPDSVDALIAEAERLCGESLQDVKDFGLPTTSAWLFNQLKQSMLSKQLRALAEVSEDMEYSELQSAVLGLPKFIYNSSMYKNSTFAEQVNEFISEVEEDQKQLKERGYIGIPTGFSKFDATVTIKHGHFIILAARPAVGKSSLACQIAVNVALTGQKVLYYTLEMSQTELIKKILSYLTKIPTFKLEHGFNKTQFEGLQKEGVDGVFQNLQIKYTPGISIDSLLSDLQIIKQKHQVDLVIIDHIDLMQNQTRKNENEATAIGRMTGALKTVAGKEGVAILALSQVNRESKGEAPKLHELRGSGAKEQDADVVALLDRDVFEQDAENYRIATMNIAKNRHGPAATIKFKFDPHTTTFAEI